jgi:hypothetical protein
VYERYGLFLLLKHVSAESVCRELAQIEQCFQLGLAFLHVKLVFFRAEIGIPVHGRRLQVVVKLWVVDQPLNTAR